jgi:hypothetical protein
VYLVIERLLVARHARMIQKGSHSIPSNATWIFAADWWHKLFGHENR